MPPEIGFDNELYLKEQTAAILERIGQFDNKLYLEFGGKLVFDYHASRVLPGFDPNVKVRLLQQLKESADILLCIHAGDIERRKLRADFGITYDADAMKLIDDLRDWGIDILAVIITRFEGQPSAAQFRDKLERRGMRVVTHAPTVGYPTDVDRIVSDEGYGLNGYIETTKPLVVVTAPGPGSGKLATCLSQLYHDHKRGISAGYAKFETFPIWNLPLKHPVNVAYEAATADLDDRNLIDPFHLEAYGKTAVNYNRDVECFPVVKRILKRIMDGDSLYNSPTDMGVNRAGFAIVNDAVVQEAAKQEIIRRYFRYNCEYAMGFAEQDAAQNAELLMEELDLTEDDRKVTQPARQAAAAAEQQKKGSGNIFCGAAMELPDGVIVTGKNSPLLHAASGLILNAVKQLAGIPDEIHLLAPAVLESIASLRKEVLNRKTVSLDVEETLIVLGISAATNPTTQHAVGKLKLLRGCEIHMTHIPSQGDGAGLRRLGLNVTSDPHFPTKSLFIS